MGKHMQQQEQQPTTTAAVGSDGWWYRKFTKVVSKATHPGFPQATLASIWLNIPQSKRVPGGPSEQSESD